MRSATDDQPAAEAIRLLVADDHHVVRQGLAAMLNREPGLAVAAEAANGREAVDRYAECRPDVALLNLRMPVLDGLEAVARIRTLAPEAKIVLLTTFDGDEGIYRGLRAGAKAYLLKDATLEELVQCIRNVHAGQICLPPNLAAKLAGRVGAPELTDREFDVLRLMAAGRSNKEIGAGLFISETTVKTHVTNVLSKLRVTSRTEAIAAAAKRGLIDM